MINLNEIICASYIETGLFKTKSLKADLREADFTDRLFLQFSFIHLLCLVVTLTRAGAVSTVCEAPGAVGLFMLVGAKGANICRAGGSQGKDWQGRRGLCEHPVCQPTRPRTSPSPHLSYLSNPLDERSCSLLISHSAWMVGVAWWKRLSRSY